MLKKLFCLSLIFLLLPSTASLSSSPLINSSLEQKHLHTSAASLNRSGASGLNERRGRPLWPGSRFTEAARARAVMRGLNFIYRTALVPQNFKEYGHDYLWCFYTLDCSER